MVESEVSAITYNYTAAETEYAIPFVFSDSSEVVARLDELDDGVYSVLTEGADYSVAGSTLTFLTTYGDNLPLVIERTVPLTQLVNFVNQGTFSPSVHEDALDHLTKITQQLHRRVTAVEAQGAVGDVVAGNGLSYGGSTLNVGAGFGITVAADTVAVDFAASGIADVTKAAASAGAATTVARADHKHNISTAAPAAGAVLIGNSADAGVATSLSLSDHIHAVTTAAPADVTRATVSPGAATSFSRSDHKHDVTTSIAVTLTDSTNGAGSASTLSLSDHTHSHGSRGGGSLHALAVADGDAGFMSGADKAKLDNLPELVVESAAEATTDGTTLNILEWTPDNSTAETITVTISAWNNTDGLGAGYVRTIAVKNTGGTTTIIGSIATTHTAEDTSGMDATVVISSNRVSVEVTGLADKNIYWVVRADRLIAAVP